ncbi:MAG: hypothetical protein ACRDP9_15190 [Kribbellaceae bacterium]
MILKLFGPSAEYLGEHWRSKLEERAQRNAGRVASRAIEKLGSRIDQPGEIPPRALRGILEEAQYSEDEVSVEYVSGVLASSRTPDGKDDRATSITATISRLSSFSLLAHYIWYTEIKRLLHDVDQPDIANLGLDRAQIFMPFSTFRGAVSDERANDTGNLMHAIHYLEKESLISVPAYGARHMIRNYLMSMTTQHVEAVPEEGGMILAPTLVGMDLYLWSQGLGGTTTYMFFDETFKPEPIPDVDIPEGAQTVAQMFRDSGLGTQGFIESYRPPGLSDFTGPASGA